MSSPMKRTAKYQRVPGPDGNRYRFFCDLSGALLCEAGPYQMGDSGQELLVAWEREGSQQANQCHCCGKWVIDAMFNADVLQCVDCAPWEDKPKFCPSCGNQVKPSDTYCNDCGAKLWYGNIKDWTK